MIRSGLGSSRGSEAAGGCTTVKVPEALRIVSPCCWTAAKVFGRKQKRHVGIVLGEMGAEESADRSGSDHHDLLHGYDPLESLVA